MPEGPERRTKSRPARTEEPAPQPGARRAGRATGLEGAHAATLELALAPLLRRIGGQVVHEAPEADDVPVEWLGETLFHVRLPPVGAWTAPQGAEPTDLSDGLARLIGAVEEELGGPLSTLPRAKKQHAVRLLEERGAFEMRRSAETVAEALGLTRFTVYNYLNRLRGGAGDAR